MQLFCTFASFIDFSHIEGILIIAFFKICVPMLLLLLYSNKVFFN